MTADREAQAQETPPGSAADSLRRFRRLLPLLDIRRLDIALLLVLGLVTSCLDGLGISLVVLFLFAAIGDVQDAIDTEGIIGEIFQQAVDLFGGNQLLIGSIVFAIVASSSVLRFVYGVLAERLGQKVAEQLRVAVHDQYLDVSYDQIRRYEASHLLNIIEDATWTVSDVIANLLYLAISVFTILVFATLLLATSWQFTILAVVGSAFLFALVRPLAGPVARWGAISVVANDALTKRTLTTLNCLRTLRAFGDEERQKADFKADARKIRDVFVRMGYISELASPISEIGHIALLCVFIGVASFFGISFAGSLTAVALLHRLRPQAQAIEEGWLELASANAALKNIGEIVDRSDKDYLPAGTKPFQGLGQEIRFDAVTMRYPGARQPALDAVSFRIPAHRTTALIGPSGAGKSTLVNLLLRLYRPAEGTIYVDGVPLFDVERRSWLAHVAVAGQDVELVEGTIGKNIAMSHPNASERELEDAAERAGVTEFLSRNPDGFTAAVGERGLRLSSGQRQRVGLARAFLRDPDILILDEAMSALDSTLEERIRDNIHTHFGSRTLLLITHRLETVMNADHIVCIDGGRVVEEGSPQELLAKPDGALQRMLHRKPRVTVVEPGQLTA